MKRLAVFHTDLDGFGCYLVAKYFKLEFDEFQFMNYPDYKKDYNYNHLNNFDEIVYADFSPNMEALEVLNKGTAKVQIFDHHESFVKDTWIPFKENNDLREGIDLYYDVERSGTKILFEHLRETKHRVKPMIIQIVALIDTYDLYKKKHELWEEAKNLNRVFYKSKTYYKDTEEEKVKFFLEGLMYRIYNYRDFMFTKTELKKIEDDKLQERDLTKTALKKILIRVDSKGRKFGLFKIAKKLSLVCSNILDSRNDIEYVIAINTWNKDELKLSLRSREDGFNLLELNNTKGHQPACGLEEPDQKYINDLWNNVISEIGYKE